MRFYILMDHGIPNEVTSSKEKYEKWLKHHDACEAVECNTDQIFNEYSQSYVDFLKKESKKNFDEFKRYQNIAEKQEERAKMADATIYELNCENTAKANKIESFKNIIKNLETQLNKKYWEGVARGQQQAVEEQRDNNFDKQAEYLKGFKEGIEWLNGVLKK